MSEREHRVLRMLGFAGLALAGPVVAIGLQEIQRHELPTDSFAHGRVVGAWIAACIWVGLWVYALMREGRGRRS